MVGKEKSIKKWSGQILSRPNLLKKVAKYGKIKYQKKGGITMETEKKKAYGNMRIISLDGSNIYRAESLTAMKNGKLNKDFFNGVLDESLDTDVLRDVYKAHGNELGYPYLAEKKYCRALVNVSFEYAIKEFEHSY